MRPQTHDHNFENYLDAEASSVDRDDHVLGGVRSPELQLQPTPSRPPLGRHHRPAVAQVPGSPLDRQGRDRRQRAERDQRTARRERGVAPGGERTSVAVDHPGRERATAPSVIDQRAGTTAGINRKGAAATPGIVNLLHRASIYELTNKKRLIKTRKKSVCVRAYYTLSCFIK